MSSDVISLSEPGTSRASFFTGRRVLVTGGTGTVGSAVVEHLLRLDPKVVRVYSRDESKQFDMRQAYAGERRLRLLLGDVRDRDRLAFAMEDIDFVVHTAAMKHVEASEYNPFEAVKTNIIGAQNVVDAATASGVERVVFTSSDKAANPSNAMGASKLMAEKLFTAAYTYRGRHKTRFATVRFGNVAGSRGSAIPLFVKQIAEGGRITLTHEDMTRFFMSTSDAVGLVLGAVAEMHGGEVFVLKMRCAAVSALIRVLIDLYAPVYGRDPSSVEVDVVGLRPGEKLYEELMTEAESERSAELDRAFAVMPEGELYGGIDGYLPSGGALPSAYVSRDAPLMDEAALRDALLNLGWLPPDLLAILKENA